MKALFELVLISTVLYVYLSVELYVSVSFGMATFDSI